MQDLMALVAVPSADPSANSRKAQQAASTNPNSGFDLVWDGGPVMLGGEGTSLPSLLATRSASTAQW